MLEEEDTLRRVLSFLPDTFRYVAAVNKKFLSAFAAEYNDSKATTFENAIQTVDTVRICLSEGGNTRKIAVLAVHKGKLDVLKSIHHEGHRIFTAIGPDLCGRAAGEGHMDVLQWLRSIGCQWCSRTCKSAAGNGHLAVLQWARANGCDWDSETCSAAAAGGHLQVLQWSRANGCDWDSSTCRSAAVREVTWRLLQWGREPMVATGIVSTCSAAAAGGHLEVLQWARANGCDWD